MIEKRKSAKSCILSAPRPRSNVKIIATLPTGLVLILATLVGVDPGL